MPPSIPPSPIRTTRTTPTNPYNSYGAGSVLSGSADYMRAYGQTVNTIEQARITRELAIQAKLDTKKKRFDLEGYIKANTPSYTEEQEKNAKLTLRRIQTNSLPGEVANGKSLNYLLNDLRKFPSKRASLEPIILTEDTLAYLNATKTVYAIGLLRDPAGRVVIPSGLDDVVKVGARQALEKQLQTLVKEAYANRIDQNLLKDVQAEIDRIRDELVKKVNDIPTPQYLEAKRFLQELSEGTRAIRLGEAMSQAKFQRWVDEGKGSRSVQELADFMIKEGFNFGPATALDEGPYRTVHAAMAAYDIAMNAQFGPEAQ
ncbi:MAG: hypothetical protein HYR84_05135 [Planctomycetes bacterium]|nr:hypothetical protein [Planctomycetota bacterium]